MGTLSPEAVEQARIRLQNLLQSALQSGNLDTVVHAILAREAGSHELSVSDVGAREANGQGPVLDLDDSNAANASQAKERIRQVLEQGLQNGTLDTVLCTLRGEPVLEDANSRVNDSRDRMVQALEMAAANGKLEEAMNDIFGKPGTRVEDTRKQLHSALQSATQTGDLHQALKTPEFVEAESDQHLASDQASRDIQVARELRQAFEKAHRDGQLEEKCSECLRPPSNDSTQDAPASDNFDSAFGNRQTEQPVAAEQASQPDVRPPRPPGPTGARPPVRRSHTQDIACVRQELEGLKSENQTLKEKVAKLEKLMEEEEQRRKEATV